MERFGLPYLGSKNKIAREIVAQLPPAEHFYDLFQRVVVMLREFGLTPASRAAVQRLAEEDKPKQIAAAIVEDLPPVGELE